jgi:large subunit ribosomal protein L29
MSLPSIKEIENLDNDSLNFKIIETKKELFNLRLKKATFASFKPHLFKHTKQKLAQLLTLQNKRQVNQKNR